MSSEMLDKEYMFYDDDDDAILPEIQSPLPERKQQPVHDTVHDLEGVFLDLSMDLPIAGRPCSSPERATSS